MGVKGLNRPLAGNGRRRSPLRIWLLLSGWLLWGSGVSLAQNQVRIKDISSLEERGKISLIGYGLVVGLDGSGDRSSGSRGSVFTVQSISNMLEQFGITVDPEQLRTRNAASVMVTATAPPYGRVGSTFDVLVSSLGDAKSLEGGILLMTPLKGAKGKYYAMAQGAISIGGYNIVTSAGERLKKNHALVGRLPGGGQLTAALPQVVNDPAQPLYLSLNEPDYVTAGRVATAINQRFGSPDGDSVSVARAISPGTIALSLPDSMQDLQPQFIAEIEQLTVLPDVDARVVINERTGTIVAGGNVTINEVMIAHGNLTIHTRRSPVISQPGAFSNGTTVADQISETTAEEDGSLLSVIPENATVSDLAASLNQLGVKPRDLIAIFQAIKEAGALRAKLVIF